VTVIHLGRGSPHRLGATYPPAPHGTTGSGGRACRPPCAGLFGIAARRDCPFHPVGRRSAFASRPLPDSSLLLWSSPRGGQVLPATLPCAVRTFLQCGLSALAPATAWWASRGW